jgi:hypothetical protein
MFVYYVFFAGFMVGPLLLNLHFNRRNCINLNYLIPVQNVNRMYGQWTRRIFEENFYCLSFIKPTDCIHYND